MMTLTMGLIRNTIGPSGGRLFMGTSKLCMHEKNVMLNRFGRVLFE